MNKPILLSALLCPLLISASDHSASAIKEAEHLLGFLTDTERPITSDQVKTQLRYFAEHLEATLPSVIAVGVTAQVCEEEPQDIITRKQLLSLAAQARNKHTGTGILHWATANQQTEIAKMVLSAEMCDPNAQDNDGNTPLHQFARLVIKETRYNPTYAYPAALYSTFIKAIKEGKVDPNMINNKEGTALHILTSPENVNKGILEVARGLIRAGACTKVLNNDMHSPLEACISATEGDLEDCFLTGAQYHSTHLDFAKREDILTLLKSTHCPCHPQTGISTKKEQSPNTVPCASDAPSAASSSKDSSWRDDEDIVDIFTPMDSAPVKKK